MRYKRLATAIFMCITTIMLSAPLKAESTASYNQFDETSQLKTPDSAVQPSSQPDSTVTLNILDIIWVFGFTVAGLVLLRKIQSD